MIQLYHDHVSFEKPFPAMQGVTRIKYCTDGVLLREMMEDPLLSTYRCVLSPKRKYVQHTEGRHQAQSSTGVSMSSPAMCLHIRYPVCIWICLCSLCESFCCLGCTVRSLYKPQI